MRCHASIQWLESQTVCHKSDKDGLSYLARQHKLDGCLTFREYRCQPGGISTGFIASSRRFLLLVELAPATGAENWLPGSYVVRPGGRSLDRPAGSFIWPKNLVGPEATAGPAVIRVAGDEGVDAGRERGSPNCLPDAAPAG